MPEEVKDAEKKSAPSTDKEDAEKPKEDVSLDDTEDEGDEETPPKGDLHKSRRWKQVHGELKAYKDAGLSPLELKAALARLAQYDKAVEDAEKAESDDEETAEAKALKKKRAAAKKELLLIYPELANVEALQGRMDTFYTSLERRATSEMTKLMKEAGLPTEAKNLASMSEVLASIIKEDEDLYLEYVGDPRAAVRAAWDSFKGDFEAAAKRSAAAELQKKKQGLNALPKTFKPGGSPEMSGKPDKGPKNLKEARERAEKRLAALE